MKILHQTASNTGSAGPFLPERHEKSKHGVAGVSSGIVLLKPG
jgi:hypothetical protein